MRRAAGVTVVIPARNAGAVLPAQLAALAAQDFDGCWGVVVADNGSTDATADCVRAAASSFPAPLRVVDAARGRGINVARNDGAAAANGSLLLFCDADDVVSTNWVSEMTRALLEFDIVGGLAELELLNSERARRRRPIIAPAVVNGDVVPIGANLGCSSAVWRELGGFDETMRLGWDEFEFCHRARRRGFTVGAAADAVVHYRLRETLFGFVKQQFGVGRGEALFRRLHPDFLPPLSLAHEVVGIGRSAVGVLRRALRRDTEAELALGWLANRIGRLVQTVALLPERARP
jgi:glycosyltransferase involved in cell wall biosynthesis